MTQPSAPVAAIIPTSASSTGTIGNVVTFKIKAGREAEAMAFFKDTAAKVEATEPGVLLYYFFQSPDDPGQVVVMEIYKDQAARDAHKQFLGGVKDKMFELLDMPTFQNIPKIAAPIGGFLR